tara:strand:- start:212 stop:352 length:141 start_codon:yes stop_codon:yes gene_type:complete
MSLKVVILAGRTGSGLWPLSRSKFFKQLSLLTLDDIVRYKDIYGKK